MSLNHLLPLSALHAAAPGVLDVVFRPDGDFKGAPPWAGPMTSLADPARHGWLVWRGALHVSVATADGHWSSTVEQWRERWALDLRIPTVAARLAGLCLRVVEGDRVIFDGPAPVYAGEFLRGAMCSSAAGGLDHVLAAELAALTLALAPKIAALKS